MATTTQPKNGTTTFEDAFERVREVNEQFADAARKTGAQYLDSYEKAIDRAIDVERKLAGATKQEWLKTVIDAHADATAELTEAYITAARKLLK